MKFLYILLALILFKLLLNISQYIKAKLFYTGYLKWVKSPNENFKTYKESIKKLFKVAGIKDNSVPHVQPVGFGFVQTNSASVMDNMFVLRKDIVQLMFENFQSAIGVYRSRIFETFSPLYWIECIIFLPEKLFQYLGADSDKLFVKIFQIIWWILAPVSIVFRNSLLSFIKHMLLYAH